MEISSEDLLEVVFKYDTIILPPPYCHRYEIKCGFQKADLDLELDLEYYDRDTIEEDEILSEGFSMNDNFKWGGTLANVWKEAARRKISRANWRKQVVVPKYPQAQLRCVVKTKNGQSRELYPDNVKYWEAFLQEIIQGIFETSKLEAPLEIGFISNVSGSERINKLITYSFSIRAVESKHTNSNSNTDSNQISWADGQKLLKNIFFFDYNYEHALTSEPSKKGVFVSTGDGYWHDLSQFNSGSEKISTAANELINKLNTI